MDEVTILTLHLEIGKNECPCCRSDINIEPEMLMVTFYCPECGEEVELESEDVVFGVQ
jgi:predicted RNA-binding Zn-ribbon protein involved in translation (DUF1610 family)